MRISDLEECSGRIVKDVNTTIDVGENEIMIQAKKFGNNVDKDGRPEHPMRSGIQKIGMSTTCINEGDIKSVQSSYLLNIKEASYEGNIGAMEVMKFFMLAKSRDVRLDAFVKRLTESDSSEDNKLAWKIIQNFLGVHLKGKGFGN